MEFEDIMEKVGDYGKFQKFLIVVFFIPCATILPLFIMSNMIYISTPDHWCRVPELEPFNLTAEEEQSLVRPQTDRSCSMYDLNYTNFLLTSENWTIPENTTNKPCLNGWNYDKTNYDNTATSQWNMVCEDSHYTSLLLTMTSVGSIIATPIFGSLSDRYGRKLLFLVISIIAFASSMASTFVTDFTTFVVLRGICGASMPAIFQLPFVIFLELVSPDTRAGINGIANCFWTVGACLLPLIAWLTRDWIKLGIITSSVILIYILQWPILIESPRWLLSREKYEEATKLMMRIAKWNGKKVNIAEISHDLQELGKRIQKEREVESEGPSILWKYPQLRKRFLIVTLFWIADMTAFYGLQINANNLAGNEFVNFFLIAVAELPGWIVGWFLMEKVGRRFCGVFGLFLCAANCFLSAAYPASAVVASFIAKFGACIATTSVYQQSSEIYPTSVRALGLSLNGSLAAMFTFAVPYIVFLNKYGEHYPFLIMGSLSALTGLCVGFLPETLNHNLPQTIADEENFGLDQKFFSLNRRKRPSCHMEMASASIFKNELSSSKKKPSKDDALDTNDQ